MTPGQIWIVVITTVIVVWISLLFSRSNRAITARGKKVQQRITNSIWIHVHQIRKRRTFLNRYNFSLYNLEESLFVQHEIRV